MIPVIAGAVALTGALAVGASATKSKMDDSKSEDSKPIRDVQITIQPAESSVTDKSEESEVPDESDVSGPDRLEAAGKTTAGAGAAASTYTAAAERAGVDRYAEAELAEQLHAEAYTREVGGTVVDDGMSVFAPDNGIDRVIEGPAGEKTVQVKHYGDSVGEAVLEQYADVDVIAASNGLKEGIDPSEYGIDVVTIDDWSVAQKIQLSWTRIKRGATKPVTSAAARIGTAVKSAAGRATTAAKTGVSGFLRLSLGKQILVAAVVVVVVGGIVYLVRKWYKDD